MSAAHYAKAIAGGLIAGASTAVPMVNDGLSLSEWLLILIAAVVGFNGVFWTPNRDPDALHQTESVQPPTA
jgi:hypothetical protein